MQKNKPILLNEDFLLGKCSNKVVYIHPDNPDRCIKISNPHAELDLWYEIRYRKARKFRHLPHSLLLTEYYGTVKTNLGDGFVFERVYDYDGATSKTIEDLIKREIESRKERKSIKELWGSEKNIPLAIDVLFQFRKALFQDNIILPNMESWNFMVQFTSPTDWQVRIVDEIGALTLIPVINYIDYLGKRYVRRHWGLFIKWLLVNYPGFFTEEEITRLSEMK